MRSASGAMEAVAVEVEVEGSPAGSMIIGESKGLIVARAGEDGGALTSARAVADTTVSGVGATDVRGIIARVFWVAQ